MKYRLTEKIGSGGMAEVFRAVGEGPQGFERPFVIKRIHPRLSEAPEFVRMFVDEAKISARLIHPNIVQVFEFAYQDGGYYIVMEPVEGMDMGWFRRRRAERRHELLPSTFVAEVGRQACRGLDFAHTLTDPQGRPLGIVHRDVSATNIMVAWNGTVKILDFGIARAVQALRTNLTDAGMVKGKMSYVAPELLDGATADARSDIFSLGAVLHELLSGRQLFAGENDLETLKQVQSMPIPPPSTLNSGVKPALDGVVMRALERDPAKRYRSAGEMGDELEALVLRKSYSTRALARKARELVQAETGVPISSPSPGAAPGKLETLDEIVDRAPELVEEAPISIGREDSSVVVDEARPRRRSTARLPPPLGGRRHSDRRWTWLAIGAPTVVAAGLAGALARQPTTPTAPIAAPAVKVTLPATAQVALNSEPQGATVAISAAGGGQRLGETPLLLELPRGRAAVELTLTKTGFVPLVYKVIPNQDKDVSPRLEAATSAPKLAAARPAARPAGRSPVALAAATVPRSSGVIASSGTARAGAPAASLSAAASQPRPAPPATASKAAQQPVSHRPAWSAPIPRR